MEAEDIPLTLMVQIEATIAEADMLGITIITSTKLGMPIEIWPAVNKDVPTEILIVMPIEDTSIMVLNLRVEEQTAQILALQIVEMPLQELLTEQIAIE